MKKCVYSLIIMIGCWSAQANQENIDLTRINEKAHLLLEKIKEVGMPLTYSQLQEAKDIKQQADIFAEQQRLQKNPYLESKVIQTIKKMIIPYLMKEEESSKASQEVEKLRGVYSRRSRKNSRMIERETRKLPCATPLLCYVCKYHAAKEMCIQ